MKKSQFAKLYQQEQETITTEISKTVEALVAPICK